MLNRSRLFLICLNLVRWPRFLAAKFEAQSEFLSDDRDVRKRRRHADDFRVPIGPGIWQRTDEEGQKTPFRVMEQNGELYARVRTLAVPVRNLPGTWTLIE
jgi:hypothetical protein